MGQTSTAACKGTVRVMTVDICAVEIVSWLHNTSRWVFVKSPDVLVPFSSFSKMRPLQPEHPFRRPL